MLSAYCDNLAFCEIPAIFSGVSAQEQSATLTAQNTIYSAFGYPFADNFAFCELSHCASFSNATTVPTFYCKVETSQEQSTLIENGLQIEISIATAQNQSSKIPLYTEQDLLKSHLGDILSVDSDTLGNVFSLEKIGVVLVEFEYSESGFTGYDFYSNTGYTSSFEDEVIPNRHYKSAILEDPFMSYSFKDSLTIGGLKLTNNGELDAYMQTRITDGRKIKIYVGSSDLSLAQFMQVFVGTIKKFRFADNAVEIILSDQKEKLNKEIQSTLFPDTEDYPAGIRKTIMPICLGSPFNISPIMIDNVGETFQFHDKTLSSTSVFSRDKGVSSANTGDFTDGKFTLTTTPVGAVTASIIRDSTLNNLAYVFKSIVTRVYPKAVFNDDTLTYPFFKSYSKDIGIFLTEKTNTVQLLDEMLNQVRACWFFNSAGAIEIAQLDVPKTTPDFTIEPYHIVSISIASNDDYELAHTVKMGYMKNWTVQKLADLPELDTISKEQKAALGRDYLGYSQAVNDGMQATYPSAILKEIENSYLIHANEAQTEAQEWATICSVPRFTISVKCTNYEGQDGTRQIRLGDTIQVTSIRYGIKKGVVTKITQHFASGIHELELFF